VVLPTSLAAALALLLVALTCFSIWPSLYKTSETHWRFEFFAFDFALGAFLFSTIIAYTLGTLGREMSFTDRILVAGVITVFWMIGTGMLLGFAIILLLASTTLLGLMVAFPLAFGIGAALSGLGHYRTVDHEGLLWGGAVILLAGAVCAAFTPQKPPVIDKRATKPLLSRKTKGVIVGTMSGVTFGLIQWLLKLTSDPDFGPGPYATVLALSIGMLLVTPFLNFFLMNIKLTGEPIKLALYLQGGTLPHRKGFVSGLIFILGVLALLLALSPLPNGGMRQAWIFIVPFCSILVAFVLGIKRWREMEGRPSTAKLLSGLSVGCFVCGICIVAFSLKAWV
jgi:glucose uptake protein